MTIGLVKIAPCDNCGEISRNAFVNIPDYHHCNRLKCKIKVLLDNFDDTRELTRRGITYQQLEEYYQKANK